MQIVIKSFMIASSKKVTNYTLYFFFSEKPLLNQIDTAIHIPSTQKAMLRFDAIFPVS